jgi:hypothetical protein
MEEEIISLFLAKYEDKALELWIDVAMGFDVEYEMAKELGKKVVKAMNPEDALLKHFGSGTLGIVPEFWYDKAVKIWKDRLPEIIR